MLVKIVVIVVVAEGRTASPGVRTDSLSYISSSEWSAEKMLHMYDAASQKVQKENGKTSS